MRRYRILIPGSLLMVAWAWVMLLLGMPVWACVMVMVAALIRLTWEATHYGDSGAY